MDQQNCRPLLQLNYLKGEQLFISLPYTYSLDDVKSLSTYISPCLKMMGVDYQKKADFEKSTKFRNICVEGVNVKNQ